MDKRRSRFVPGASFINECLERREVLSAAGTAQVAHAAREAATKTTLAVSATTFGQSVTLTATVRAAASTSWRSPTRTVAIVDHGKVLGTIALSPTAATNSRYAYSQATAYARNQPPGDGLRMLLRQAPAHRRVHPRQGVFRERHRHRHVSPWASPRTPRWRVA